MSATFPGSKARIEFIEFKGMPRKEFSIRVTDPGASGMAIRVKQIQSLLADAQEGRHPRVVEERASSSSGARRSRTCSSRIPNGLNLELVGTPPGVPAVPAPGTQPGRGRGATQ